MRLPVYDQQQVAPQAAPDVHAEALVDPAGGAVGQGLQQLGSGLEKTGDVMLDAKDRFDAIAATNAHTQLKHDVDSGLYGADPNAPPVPLVSADTGSPIKQSVPDVPTGPSQQAQQAATDGISGLSSKGVLNERGMAASAYSHPTLDWMAKRRDEIAAGLQNDNQRRKFLATSAGTLEDARVNVERHTAQQNQLVQEASLHAATAATLSGVANNYFDPASVERQLSGLEPSIKALALSPEDAAAKIANVRQEAYRAVVGQFIADKDWKGAQAALTVHQEALGYGEHGAETVERLKHSVGVLRDQQEAQVLAHGLSSSSAIGGSGLADLAKFDVQRGAVPTQKMTPDAERETARERGRLEQQNVAVTSNHFGSALSQWEDGHTLTKVDPNEASWLQAYAPMKWHALEKIDEDWKREQGRGRGKSNEVTPEDLATGRLLADMAANSEKYDPKQGGMTFEAFASGFAAPLGRTGYNEAKKKYAEIQAAAAKGDKDTAAPVTAQRVILEKGHGVLWDKENPTKMDDNAAAAFRYLNTQAEQFRRDFKAQHKGNEPLTEDYEKALAPQFQKVQVPGMLWGTNDVPLVQYRTSSKYRGADGQPTKPLVVPDDFKAALKARKGDLSPAQESKYYDAWLKAGGGKMEQPAPTTQDDRFKYDHPNVQRVLGGSPDFVPAAAPRAQLRPPEHKKAAPKKPEPTNLVDAMKGAQADLQGVADQGGGE